MSLGADDPARQGQLGLPVVGGQPAGGVLRGTEDWGLGGERKHGADCVLDTTKKVTWNRRMGPRPTHAGFLDARPRRSSCRERGRPGRLGGHTGRPAHVPNPKAVPDDRDGRRLATAAAPGRRELGRCRFSPDGQTLLVESAGPSDRVLAVDPGRADSARQLLLEGDLPSEQVRTELLGWVGADKMLAVVHEATGARTWQADADLALLTLDLDAGTADVAVVGHVDAGDTGSAFSYATDLLAVDIPTDEPAKPVAEEPGPARDSDDSSTWTPRTRRPSLAALGCRWSCPRCRTARDDSPTETHLRAPPATRHTRADAANPGRWYLPYDAGRRFGDPDSRSPARPAGTEVAAQRHVVIAVQLRPSSSEYSELPDRSRSPTTVSGCIRPLSLSGTSPE